MTDNTTPEWLKELVTMGTQKVLPSQRTLFNLGDKVDHIYLILNGGMVLLHVHPETGVERAINFFIPDFHPMATTSEAYYLGTPSKYHLKTFTNTTYVEITKQDFDRFYLSSAYGAEIQDYGIRALLEKNELRAKLISYTSEEMLQYLYRHLPQIIQQVPSKYIANFLGITPQWLSKLKHKL